MEVPGAAHLSLVPGVAYLDEPAAVFEAMLGGWERQQRSRLVGESTVNARLRLIRRFRDFAEDYPWRWGPGDMEDFTSFLKSQNGLAASTIRGYQVTVRLFCDYLTDRRYDWAEECSRRFGAFPVQICHEWNTVAHLAEYEGRPERRPTTADESQAFFDHADSRVAALVSAGRKGALAALRDAQMFKTAYAFACGGRNCAIWTWPTCVPTRTCRSGAVTGRCMCATARPAVEALPTVEPS